VGTLSQKQRVTNGKKNLRNRLQGGSARNPRRPPRDRRSPGGVGGGGVGVGLCFTCNSPFPKNTERNLVPARVPGSTRNQKGNQARGDKVAIPPVSGRSKGEGGHPSNFGKLRPGRGHRHHGTPNTSRGSHLRQRGPMGLRA